MGSVAISWWWKKLWEAQGILILSCSSLTLTLPKNKNKKKTPKHPKNTKKYKKSTPKIQKNTHWRGLNICGMPEFLLKSWQLLCGARKKFLLQPQLQQWVRRGKTHLGFGAFLQQHIQGQQHLIALQSWRGSRSRDLGFWDVFPQGKWWRWSKLSPALATASSWKIR